MTKNNQLSRSVKRNALILAMFALVSTLLVAFVHQLTKKKIANEIQRVMNQQLNSLVNPTWYDNLPSNDCLMINDYYNKNNMTINQIFRMRKNGQSTATVFSTTAHNGYSGDINFLVALDSNKNLLGIETIKHSETPGLGDKIESRKSDWSSQFKNIKIDQLDKQYWAVKKDGGHFDALTGATITPRAVINSTYYTIEYFKKNKQRILSQKSNCINDDK